MYKESRVCLNAKRQIAIVVEEKGNNIKSVISDGSVRVADMKKAAFEAAFPISSEHNPAEAATTLLNGNRVKDPRAKLHLEAISKEKYTMTDKKKEAAPTKASKKTAAAPAAAPAAAAPAAKPAKTPKEPKPPVIDPATGQPVVKARKVRPPAVPYVLGQKLVEVAANPKRAGCAAFGRYELYKVGKSFEELLKDGLTRADFAYDLAHGFIKAGPAPAAPAAAAPSPTKK